MQVGSTDSAVARVARTGTGEVLLAGITPPRLKAGDEGLREAARQARDRLTALDVDAVAVYDLTDEKGRGDTPRPFPYSPTLDPAAYVDLIGPVAAPYVVYRSVGKYTEDELSRWLREQPAGTLTVFVGAASRDDEVATTLDRAHELRAELRPDLVLGAVAIPERHAAKGDEPRRLLRKQRAGVSFCVTQIVYDVDLARRFVTDYAAEYAAAGVRPMPIVFTLSLCGSAKQVDLLQWLGVHLPHEVERDLRDGGDTLEVSALRCRSVARELADVCRGLGLPFGFDVEALAGRPKELDARHDLAVDLADLLRR